MPAGDCSRNRVGRFVTELIYTEDAYVKEFEAVVVGVEGDAVSLSRTAFYPGGGGQPSDQGTIRWDRGEVRVASAGKRGGNVLHTLEGESPSLGAPVAGVLDWERRYALMRTHTALHILCAVVYRDFGTWVTGSNMKPNEARMDFELDRLSVQFTEDVERRINVEVEEARPIRVRILPREEAFQIPELIRTKINLLPEGIAEVRTVEIEGLDLQADGRTHVANTREVGPIRVVGHESKGKINKRLRIALSPA